MWCYGFRRLGGPQELEELEKRRRKLKVESICVNDGTITLHIRNLGYECSCGLLKIQLIEFSETAGRRHTLKPSTPVKCVDTLASYRLTGQPTEEITLHPKNKLQKGHKYKLVISTEHKTYDYNFTINDSGNVIPIHQQSD
ncbi:MAG: hypothetical protein KIH01_07335 [Candidatus Freyarchaeota archaeon]|nr:hypothetical protein [Candidatus Jordarchaeia archaeon]